MSKTKPHPGSVHRQFYIESPLPVGETVALPHGLSRRLIKVLRAKEGQHIALFNGKEGVVSAVLGEQAKTAFIQKQLKPFAPTSAVTLFIGLPKRDTMDRVLRQATELGVESIQPLLTDYAVPDRLNTERAQTVLTEAAEQCERLDLPHLMAPCTLKDAVQSYQAPICWAYERQEEQAWPKNLVQPAGLLVGPEGGFSPEEAAFLKTQDHVISVGLGTTILRVDTAVTAGLGRFFAYCEER